MMNNFDQLYRCFNQIKKYIEAAKFFKRAKELGASCKNFEDLGIKLLKINFTVSSSNKINNQGDQSKEKLKHIYELFHNKNYQASLYDVKKLLYNFPNSILLYNLIGILFHKLKRFEDALANYRIAIKLSPVNPEILINLGNVHRDLKNFDEALICFRDALELKPKNYKLNCWANFLKAGDYQSNHIHNLGWMSGVYYVDLPELENENAKNEGFIAFNRAGYGLPHFGKEEGIKLIKPETGMIIFPPSQVWHGTIPFSGSKSRVSISFDISFS